ncbi:hypothetical protein [Pedobacter suwonensis]|uniref:hypothetical protein n=1 Tax=Pedobacter suwonensis TaxID=332999 RepID=UPI0036CB2486
MAQSINYFEHFKPIRNKIKKLNLFETLAKLHALLNSKKGMLPEVAEFFYVNLLLYAQEDLPAHKNAQRYLQEILNDVVELDNMNAAQSIDFSVWRFLHTLMLNQLKASHQNLFSALYKYYFIFSMPKIAAHIESKIGMPYKDFFMCAFWLHAKFGQNFAQKRANFVDRNKNSVFSPENMNRTLELLAKPLDELKAILKTEVTYDHNLFIFHGHAHLTHPVFTKGDNLYCMYPDQLLQQFTGGIYYITQIYEPAYGLSDAFGKAFENYVGLILNKINRELSFNVQEEIVYKIGNRNLKTSDWIISSAEELVFIECKTKRLRLPSKRIQSIEVTLDEDRNSIATAVLQLYKVYVHYSKNLITGLPFDPQLKFTPIVVTLEEWYAGGPGMDDRIEEEVKRLLLENGLSDTLVEEHKYKVYSIASFEYDVQLMFDMGFHRFFEKRRNHEITEEVLRDFPYIKYFEKEFDEHFLDPLKS